MRGDGSPNPCVMYAVTLPPRHPPASRRSIGHPPAPASLARSPSPRLLCYISSPCARPGCGGCGGGGRREKRGSSVRVRARAGRGGRGFLGKGGTLFPLPRVAVWCPSAPPGPSRAGAQSRAARLRRSSPQGWIQPQPRWAAGNPVPTQGDKILEKTVRLLVCFRSKFSG